MEDDLRKGKNTALILLKEGVTLLDIVWNRTSFLLKENKYFTQINFWFPVAYVTVVGLFFRDKALECRVLNQEQVKRREQRPYFQLSRKSVSFPSFHFVWGHLDLYKSIYI